MKSQTSKEAKEGMEGTFLLLIYLKDTIDLILYYQNINIPAIFCIVKEAESTKDTKSVDKFEKEQHTVSIRQADIDQKEKSDKGDKGNTSEGRGTGSSSKLESKDGDERGKEAQNVEKPDQEVSGSTPKSGAVKSGKKKIVKKIIKQKAKTVGDAAASKKNDQVDEKVDGEQISDFPSDQPSNDSATVKAPGKKKVIKRVGKSPQNEKNKDTLPKVENEVNCSEDKSKDNSDLNAAVGQDPVVKTTVKKKVIKRVPKKKVTVEEVSKKGEGGDANEKKVTADETHNVEKSTADDKQEKKSTADDKQENKSATDDKQEKKIPKSNSTSPAVLKRRDSVNLKKSEKEPAVKNDNDTGKAANPVTTSIDKQKVGEKDSSDGKKERSRDGEQSKDEKEKMGKDESRSKPNKDLKEKRKSEEPPRHPGLILQTRWSKDSKVGLF